MESSFRLMRTPQGARLVKTFLLILLALLCLVVKVAPSLAEEEFTVTVGEDKLFTDFNYHVHFFNNPPPNDYLPLPDTREARSEGNTARGSLIATPGHAGEAEAWVGVEFTWNLGAYTLEEVAGWRLRVTLDFSYDLGEYYGLYTGSAHSGVTYPFNPDPWTCFLGDDEPPGLRQAQNRVSVSYPIGLKALEDFGRKIYVRANCHAHSTELAENKITNYSYAIVTIHSIKIEFLTPVLLIHGLNLNDTPTERYWATFINFLNAEGIEYHIFDYGRGIDSPEIYAQQLANWIENLRSTLRYYWKFDLICHSYGAMVSRWYMKELQGWPNIRQWIGIAPVNHGAAVTNNLPLFPSIQAMQTKSRQLARLNYNKDQFNLHLWKTAPEALPSKVLHRVMVGLGHWTDCVNKDEKQLKDIYPYRTVRGDGWVPLFQSQLQGVGIDCFPGGEHNSLLGEDRVVSRAITYLKHPYISSLNNIPTGRDPNDVVPIKSNAHGINLLLRD
jgi:pimeloyl-ACP methyl ester carboxylesterase